MKVKRDQLNNNKTTALFYTEISLTDGDNIMAKCNQCGEILKFKIFFGDSFYLKIAPCPKCVEEAKEIGRKEIEKRPWKRLFEYIKLQQGEEINNE